MNSEAAVAGPAVGKPQEVYAIEIEEVLDQSWEQWLDGLAIEPASAAALSHAVPGLPQSQSEPASLGRTKLTGAVADQSVLRGLLCRLWDLNLTIVSVQRIERGECGG